MNEICLSCRKHPKCGRAKVETIGCGYYQPMTNEEWLRSCTTEELTELFMRFMFDADFKTRFVNGNFTKEMQDWLKKKHES